jgi:hypothetical protein
MNTKRYVLLAAVIMTFFIGMSAKEKQVPKIYAFGFSASFNDSIVYFTDIQEIENVWVQEKSNFLASRENYSYQLRDYLASQNQAHRTCIFTYAFDRKHIEKKYVKMKGKYTKKGDFDVRYITAKDFHFTAVEPIQVEEVTNEQAPKEKDKKKDKRPAKSNDKRGGKGSKGTPPAQPVPNE